VAFHINYELKAKSNKLDKIRQFLSDNCTLNNGVDNQKDTYFNTANGRLKLREGNVENSLIFYNRPDLDGPKQSDVNLVKLTPNSGVREALRKANGIKVVVDKKREIYFIDNVKFHIDEVSSLGSFVEIEAIDSDGSIGIEKLKEQCDFYIDKFQIEDQDFISCSYSDLIIEQGAAFRAEIKSAYDIFVPKVMSDLKAHGISHSSNPDHACYRVESMADYEKTKTKFLLISDLLIESEVGGRLISTFKLHTPLVTDEVSVDVIELPQPKENNKYSKGLEHLEFVIAEKFEDFNKLYPNVEFDWKGTNKPFNPELRLKLGAHSVKFHHQSLEEVIRIETATK